MIEFRSLSLCATKIRTGQLCPFFDIPDDGIFQFVAVILQQMAITKLKVPGPPRFEDLVCAREIGLRVFDDATEGPEDITLGFNDCRHGRIHRKPSQVPTPGDPDSFEISV